MWLHFVWSPYVNRVKEEHNRKTNWFLSYQFISLINEATKREWNSVGSVGPIFWPIYVWLGWGGRPPTSERRLGPGWRRWRQRATCYLKRPLEVNGPRLRHSFFARWKAFKHWACLKTSNQRTIFQLYQAFWAVLSYWTFLYKVSYQHSKVLNTSPQIHPIQSIPLTAPIWDCVFKRDLIF